MINSKAELQKFVHDLMYAIDGDELEERMQITNSGLMFDMLKEVVNQTPLPDIDKIYQVVKKRHQ